MKICEEKFYVLEVELEKEIYQTEEEAIQALKEQVKGSNIDEKTVNIVVVDVAGEWKISQVPWSRIAIQLLKGG